jgi:hypothetical protein
MVLTEFKGRLIGSWPLACMLTGEFGWASYSQGDANDCG